MKKTWKKIMAACCAVVMLVTLPCVYVYADESKQEEVGIADTVEITEEQSTIDDFSDLNEATYVEAETPAEVTEAAETFEIAGNNETVDLEAAISDVEEVGGSGDDYPANLKNAARDSIVDPWNFYNRECTSFVAWCLNSRNGVHFTNQYLGAARWGNANTWGTVAAEKGVRVDKNPAVGAVAWWNTGKYGHVAWVNSVNGGNVFIEEYNYSSKGNYDTRTIAASNPTGYIHIADINPNPVEIEAGYYKIQYGGNRFLNVSGNLTDDGTNIDIYSSVTYPGQTFYIDWNWNHSGYYIQHLTSQKYVTTDTNSSGPHNVSLFSGNGNDGQQWIAEDAGDGYVYLRNLYGYYLDVCNGVNADQQNVQVWNYNGGEAQKWKLIRVSGEDMMSVEPGYYKLQYGDNRFLNVSGNLTEDGTNIDIYSSVTYPGQTFYIDRNWNNSGYYLQHLTSQKYVTTDTNSTGPHNVILLSGNGNDGQQWIIEDAGDGYVYLRNLYGYYLDVCNGINADQQNVQVWNYNGSAAQKWRLVRYLGDENCTVTLSPASYTYDGKEKKPSVTVTNETSNLTNGTDYEVAYSDNINAGTATVTIKGTGNYSGTITKSFSISKATPSLKFANTSLSKTTTDAAFTNTLTKTTDGTVTFKSSNTAVATVNSTSGRVTIKGTGKTTITATATEGTNYKAGSAKYTLTVTESGAVQSISLSETSITMVCGNERAVPSVSYNPESATDGKTVNWISSNEKLVKVSDGRIRALDPGKAVITATVPGKNVSANADVRVLFTDVTNADAWYFDAVYWALDNNVTSGYGKGTFKPTAGLTRAQTVTFLYNLAGKPNVDGLTAQEFTDVRTSDWYYSAVKWAAANKITSGYGQGTFRPNATCTRSMIVSFLMSYSKLVGTYMPPESSANFPDVPPSAWYKTAVDWAVENGITKGYGAGTFSPDVTCNRAMMVTFLKKTAELPKV